MALSDKTNLLVQNYVRRQYPEFEEGLRRFIADELQRIETVDHFTGKRLQSKSQTTHHQPRSKGWSATQCHRGTH